MRELFSNADDRSSNNLKSLLNSGNELFYRNATFQLKLTSPKRHGFICSSTKELLSINSNDILTTPTSILKAMRKQSTNILRRK